MFVGANQAMADPTTISLDGLWSWGTLYGLSAGVWNALPPANPYYGTTSQSIPDNTVVAPDGTEDAYGMMRINQIVRGSSLVYDRATSPYELTIFYYGFDDIYLQSQTATQSKLLATGGHAAVYMDYAKDYNPTSPPGAQAVSGGGGRADGDPSAMATITNGTKILDLTPRLLWDPTAGTNYTLFNTFDFATLSGFGSVEFDVTGGTWSHLFDTNTLPSGSDLKLNFSSFPPLIPGTNWTVQGTGNVQADMLNVPEPATMAIFGMGLLGMGTLTRRKRKV
jgi:hypothetical protein